MQHVLETVTAVVSAVAVAAPSWSVGSSSLSFSLTCGLVGVSWSVTGYLCGLSCGFCLGHRECRLCCCTFLRAAAQAVSAQAPVVGDPVVVVPKSSALYGRSVEAEESAALRRLAAFRR